MSPKPTRTERPRLITRRLILQPLRPRDAPVVFDAIVRSRRTLRPWVPFASLTRRVEDTLAFIRRASRRPNLRAWGVWEREAPGLFCGNLGLHGISPEQATASLGYWIRGEREGRGYATEAGAAVLLWAFGPLRLERMSVQAATGNAASLRVIRKLGFVREGVLRQAQRLPGRRQRLDWVALGMTRGDLRRVRRRLVCLCGTARPWERGEARRR
jgi:ribosomal-protein-serine acetyltransferase